MIHDAPILPSRVNVFLYPALGTGLPLESEVRSLGGCFRQAYPGIDPLGAMRLALGWAKGRQGESALTIIGLNPQQVNSSGDARAMLTAAGRQRSAPNNFLLLVADGTPLVGQTHTLFRRLPQLTGPVQTVWNGPAEMRTALSDPLRRFQRWLVREGLVGS